MIESYSEFKKNIQTKKYVSLLESYPCCTKCKQIMIRHKNDVLIKINDTFLRCEEFRCPICNVHVFDKFRDDTFIEKSEIPTEITVMVEQDLFHNLK